MTTKRRMRKPESYMTITPEIASMIIELHKEHHRLGHDGLLKLLADARVEVDSAELSDFLDHHDIHGEKWELAWGHIPGRFRINPLGGVIRW
jgi:hypothetical protein